MAGDFPSSDIRERAATFDHTVRGALSPPHTSRAPGFATQDHARVGDSNAAQGTRLHPGHGGHFGKPVRRECQGCSEARRPSHPAPTYSIFRSDGHLPAMVSADRRLLQLRPAICHGFSGQAAPTAPARRARRLGPAGSGGPVELREIPRKKTRKGSSLSAFWWPLALR